MDLRNSNAGTHLKTAGGALLNWWRAATLDALIVGVLWLVGLELIRVPWAPFWAILGGVLQIIPTFGGMVALDSVPSSGREAVQRPTMTTGGASASSSVSMA